MAFELKTKRLRIIPLSPYYLQLLLEDIKKLETELGMIYHGVPMEEGMIEAAKELFLVALTDPENYIWHTLWQFVLIDQNIIIGSACFKGVPDEDGCVEIGYGINEAYEHKGYTREAAETMCKWARNQANVKSIIAETEKDNFPSHKILKNCGMKIYKQTEESIWWRDK